ncbi:MAG: T9SS type A sorting domain-containing protein [Candidatus Marinimicrobia bacterium]|nr:T9SS type A sorting domain-containing protein [Candidatus Neomarinimicrobiota bacterium]
MRKYISIIFILVGLHFAFGFSPTGCTYDVSENVLTIQFLEPVKTDNVLIGLLSISDNNSTIQLTGGDILNPNQLADFVEINMVYGTVLDTRSDLMYWGNTNQQAVALEELDIDNLTLNVSEGAFLDGLYQPNSQDSSIPITITNNINAYPEIIDVVYDAGLNLLHFYFDRTVQFDQIAEDQSCSSGTEICPGNKELDGGENPEDANGNGVLEMESNINPFKIQFISGENEMTLEGFRSIVDTLDSPMISLYPTISDAKKLELNIIEPAISPVNVIINKSAFVDLNYNPNETDTLALNIIVDAMPLILTNTTYDLGLNEFLFYFDNSRDIEKLNPFPVYSKIKIVNGDQVVALNGVKAVSLALGNYLRISELLFTDQKAVENLILNSNPSDTIYVVLEPYAIYDVMGNGNPTDTLALDIIGQYNNPILSSISYDSESNRIVFDWSPTKVVYYETTRLYEIVENLAISGITVTNANTGDELAITSADVSRNNNQEKTYLEVSEADSRWFEVAGVAGDSLIISAAPYLFYSTGNSNNNGNFAIIDSDINYMMDLRGPSISTSQLDFENEQLIIMFNKNINTNQSNFDSVTLEINGSEVAITGLQLTNTEVDTENLIYQIPEDQFANISASIPSNEIFEINVILQSGAFSNIDGTSGLACQDLNNDGTCDTIPEPFMDYGTDNIQDVDEPGYPGSCEPSGGCSDPTLMTQEECEAAVCSNPQYTTEDDCLADGSCFPRFYGNTLEACEGHSPPGVWNSDNDWVAAGAWALYETETLCNDGGAIWTPNLDPVGDNYDSTTNPTGTEGNNTYDFGEVFTELYVNGIWDPFEPTTKKLSYGKTMWNTSHRAFADLPAEMFFVLPYQSSDFDVYVEESVWEGRCHKGDDDVVIGPSRCTESGVEFVNGRCVFIDVKDEASCLAIQSVPNWAPVWTVVNPQDVIDVAEFYQNHKDGLMTTYGPLDGKVSVVLYDISDEFGKGSNDTNSSLFTHGYFSIDEATETGVNAGDILYLDVSPQIVYNGTSSIPDEETMYNALVHEFTKLLVTKNEPAEEVWLKEGLAYFEQKRLLGETKFFGNLTDPGSPAANQLTYISFSKKNRTDHHNVYLFLNYLFEKYSGNTGWEIIDEIASSDFIGIAAIDSALITMDPGSPDTKEVFIQYATACFLDMTHELGVYDGMYNLENVDLYGPPASKNAAAIKFNDNRPPPYSIREIPPWSFGFHLIEGFSVSLLDNSVSFKSPLLNPLDDLVFDGYDGINFRANKIMLKSGFTKDMDPMYEVVGFDLDSLTSRGILPVTTNTIPGEDFEFKKVTGSCEDEISLTQQECCTANGGIWSGSACDGSTSEWIWSGNMNLILIAAKVDDTQPPASFDFVVTNITSPQDFSDFYVMQNPGIHNFLDLYVASQRSIFDELGIEGPRIQVASEFDTTYVLLNSIPSPNADLVMYYSPFILGEWDEYTLTYSGTDQSGNLVDTDVVQVSINYTTTAVGRIINSGDDDVGLMIYDTDFNSQSFIYIENSALISSEGFVFDVNDVTPETHISYFGPEDYVPARPVKVSFDLKGLNENTSKIYHLTPEGWINIGGTVENGQIRAYSEQLGYFLLATSENHLQDQTIYIIPDQYALNQNYPNPFNPVTNIGFSLPQDQNVVLNIYNMNGQHIRTLTDGFYTAGEYSVRWDGSIQGGIMAPTGVYFARLSTENYNQTIKMVLMK